MLVISRIITDWSVRKDRCFSCMSRLCDTSSHNWLAQANSTRAQVLTPPSCRHLRCRSRFTYPLIMRANGDLSRHGNGRLRWSQRRPVYTSTCLCSDTVERTSLHHDSRRFWSMHQFCDLYMRYPWRTAATDSAESWRFSITTNQPVDACRCGDLACWSPCPSRGDYSSVSPEQSSSRPWSA